MRFNKTLGALAVSLLSLLPQKASASEAEAGKIPQKKTSLETQVGLPDITCHVALEKYGDYKKYGGKEIFDRVAEFYKERTGKTIEFRFYDDESQLPKPDENDFVIDELDDNEKDKQLIKPLEKVIKKYRSLQRQVDERVKTIDERIKALERIKKRSALGDEQLNYLKKNLESFRDRAKRQSLQLEIERLKCWNKLWDYRFHLEGFAQKGGCKVYLVEDPYEGLNNRTPPLMSPDFLMEIAFLSRTDVEKKAQESRIKKMKLDYQQRKKKYEEYMKRKLKLGKRKRTKTVAHELGHLFRLKHTKGVKDYFTNPSLDDYVSPGVPNVMSYELTSPKGKYGFDIVDAQAEKVRKYIQEKGKRNEGQKP